MHTITQRRSNDPSFQGTGSDLGFVPADPIGVSWKIGESFLFFPDGFVCRENEKCESTAEFIALLPRYSKL